MNTLINRPNLRCRKLAWMKESVWTWYMPMIDWMDDLMPSVLSVVVGNKYTAVSMGVNQLCDWSTGPPH